MQVNDPLVSILLAVHNGAEFLQEALTSVVNQSYSNLELIVVDNASTDDSAQIVKSIEDERIRYFYLPKKGKIEAFNLGFIKSKGDIVCFFAADDILPPDSISLRVGPLLNSGSNYSTCLLQTVSANPKFNGLVFPKNKFTPNYSGGSILFSRGLAETIFPIPVVLPNEDTWASLHLRAFGSIAHVQTSLYLYRIHSNNSYGYDLPFLEKRQRFVRRMSAFKMFLEKWKGIENAFISAYVSDFAAALTHFENGNIVKILFLRGVPTGDKLKFIMFSSKFLFYIRNRFFSFFSGFAN